MSNINWTSLLNDVNDAYDNFLATLSDAFNRCCPLQKFFKSEKKPLSPWLSLNLLKSIRTKNKLYKYYLANPNPANKTNYTTYKNILPQSIRVAKRLFFENQFDNYKGNIRKTWGIINQMLQRGNSRTLPDYIMNGNTTLDDPVMMANAFNTFFVNIGENLASEICGKFVKFVDCEFYRLFCRELSQFLLFLSNR